jgi:hypothetical protein
MQPLEDKTLQTKEKNIKPQEVITIFRNISEVSASDQWIGYPELQEFFDKGYYIEEFQQTAIDSNRFMITFNFRKFSQVTY